MLAPIVLFVYNRPWHTKQTLEALANNKLAYQSRLYIYADGPKKYAVSEEIEKTKEVEDLINNGKWCKEQIVIKRTKNWGLAENIVDGVTTIVNRYGKVIVLEDDIIATPGFLTYMNEALEIYKNEPEVMHVSGYLPNISSNVPDTFFYNQTSCWGWGTWKSSWENLNLDAGDLLDKIISSGSKFHFDLDGSYPFSQHLWFNQIGKMSTWAVKWHASVYLKNGFCLHPGKSLTVNIGNDGSGTNSGNVKAFETQLHNKEVIVKKLPLEEDQFVRRKIIEFNYKNGIYSTPDSPVTNKNNVKLVKKIKTSLIIKKYAGTLNLDVSKYFNSIPEIKIFECQDTGYQFYYPFHISGDSKFYEHLEKFDWYYMPWKWEHEMTFSFLERGMKLLEVGAANGSFIEKANNAGIESYGLELNQERVKVAQKNKIKIYAESIEEHAKGNKNKYDVVCSFQVLEHIADVRTFINAQIDSLKVGGRLVISVPNNDSFLGRDFNILNTPPHHMGKWNEDSLKAIIRYFPIKLERIYFEPLQDYHEEYFESVVKKVIHQKIKLPKSLISKFKFLFKLFTSKKFQAFTIQAVYVKNEVS